MIPYPKMSIFQDSMRARHRQREARYEARLRDGIGLIPMPLRASVTAGLPPMGRHPFSTNHSKNGKKDGPFSGSMSRMSD
jgi:hypothetical protein